MNNNATPDIHDVYIPVTGFLRLNHIIGDKKRGIPGIIPVGRTTWLEGVKTGKYPKPVKLSPRTVAWRVEDVRALINELSENREAA
ncbi:helix-turn-helix transcriptional regulator [Solemya velum gill symbiont]|uniref:helix-turn-helix transcriptional regulator n=1 Tax=Solemya velum gill symbiont TaxID=2340 RepID=UPI000997AF25|nr:AlpA family phage regulatory protein [Solemya velum gill symbiont]OOZ44260.1 AlpA family transcriptional regulator [Solemya velum gill symbiont]OOZ47891.1 AlpA family transcriptional regulator [Solemya velum gill symbiont]OOZ48025.1 AlpA family transcriptional regulator [Solemya velum gill symbiont]OOZ52967.1 AlpA family transcriptional regulator [Solemya velum gill symbiont]OOZ55600.1 AlpA family transcriptional regulator [Solemya velum gill symbiont]